MKYRFSQILHLLLLHEAYHSSTILEILHANRFSSALVHRRKFNPFTS